MISNSNHEGEFIYNLLIHRLNRNPLGRTLPMTSYWYENFDVSFLVFREATDCYDCGKYEASAVMCRNSVDSFLYLATRMRNIRDWHDIDDEIGIDERVYDTYYEMDDKIFKNINSDKEEVNYIRLTDIMKSRNILTDDDLKYIKENIRDKGNFSAHLLEAIDRASAKWWKEHEKEFHERLKDGTLITDKEVFENFRPKSWTTEDEALKLLKDTSKALEGIVVNYYRSEHTIKAIYHGNH